MGTIFQAIEEAQHKYRPAKSRHNDFTGDLDDISASAKPGACSCRGNCGSHIGPCGIKASGDSKVCKTCISAGGPGSGKHKGFITKFEQPSKLVGKFNKADNLADKHSFKSERFSDKAEDSFTKGKDDKGAKYAQLSDKHGSIASHFEKAADHYDHGREKQGDKHFAKGMALRSKL